MTKWDHTKEVSPAQAIAAAHGVEARTGPAKTLAVALAALREVVDGRRTEVTLGAAEVRAIVDHITHLNGRARSAETQRGIMEKARNNALVAQGVAETKVAGTRADVEEWIARGVELLGKVAP
jgi:hypothetical protein